MPHPIESPKKEKEKKEEDGKRKRDTVDLGLEVPGDDGAVEMAGSRIRPVAAQSSHIEPKTG